MSDSVKERIELIRASVRPRLLILATLAYFVFGFSEIPVRESVLDTFRYLVIGGWAWYFGERAWTHFKELK